RGFADVGASNDGDNRNGHGRLRMKKEPRLLRGLSLLLIIPADAKERTPAPRRHRQPALDFSRGIGSDGGRGVGRVLCSLLSVPSVLSVPCSPNAQRRSLMGSGNRLIGVVVWLAWLGLLILWTVGLLIPDPRAATGVHLSPETDFTISKLCHL